jgi:hypothetical protein
MNKQSSPAKNGRDDEKKREEQNRRRFHFGVSYLITSLTQGPICVNERYPD